LKPQAGTRRKVARREQDPDKTKLVRKTSSSDPDMSETTSQKPQKCIECKRPAEGMRNAVSHARLRGTFAKEKPPSLMIHQQPLKAITDV